MPIVCGIKFRGAGKIYFFDPSDLDLVADDYVIVETTRGKEIAQVAEAPHEVDQDEIVGDLKPVVRRASSLDLVQSERYRLQEKDALNTCVEQVARYNLDMKIVGAEYSYDGSRLTFFFTADERVDFRELVRELAHIFKTRIELRQIGVRDEAKLLGGVGKCGRTLCCTTWLQHFSPISIRMAKQQDLPLSPMEISGACGRLLCCLGYEDDYYRKVKKQFPRVGRVIDSPVGRAKVIRVSVLRETVRLLLEDGSTIDLTSEQLSGEEPIQQEKPADMRQELDAHLLSKEPVGASKQQSDQRDRSRQDRGSRGGRSEDGEAASDQGSGDKGQSSASSRRSRRRRSRRRPSSKNSSASEDNGSRRNTSSQGGGKRRQDAQRDGGHSSEGNRRSSDGGQRSSRSAGSRRRRPRRRSSNASDQNN